MQGKLGQRTSPKVSFIWCTPPHFGKLPFGAIFYLALFWVLHCQIISEPKLIKKSKQSTRVFDYMSSWKFRDFAEVGLLDFVNFAHTLFAMIYGLRCLYPLRRREERV